MLTRPPPLQLQYDNTRSGLRLAPQSERLAPQKVDRNKAPDYVCQISAFLSEVYQANWRNFVIGVTTINALRFLITALTAFHDANVDVKTHHVSKLSRFSIALGALYLATAVLQLYGALSAALQRITLIRVYVYFALLSTLLVTTAGFITSVEYFWLADDIISECVTLSVSGSWISKSIFRGKLKQGEVPSIKVAQEQCLGAWSRSSVSQVIAVFLFYLIPALAFFLLAYTYYRQTTDPTHPANLLYREKGSRHREGINLEAYPDVRYSPVYQDEHRNGNARNENGRRGEAVRAPASRVSTNARVIAKNANVDAANPLAAQMQRLLQLSPLMRSASSGSPYGISPGPPSFTAPRPRYEYGYSQGHVLFDGNMADDR